MSHSIKGDIVTKDAKGRPVKYSFFDRFIDSYPRMPGTSGLVISDGNSVSMNVGAGEVVLQAPAYHENRVVGAPADFEPADPMARAITAKYPGGMYQGGMIYDGMRNDGTKVVYLVPLEERKKWPKEVLENELLEKILLKKEIKDRDPIWKRASESGVSLGSASQMRERLKSSEGALLLDRIVRQGHNLDARIAAHMQHRELEDTNRAIGWATTPPVRTDADFVKTVWDSHPTPGGKLYDLEMLLNHSTLKTATMRVFMFGGEKQADWNQAILDALRDGNPTERELAAKQALFHHNPQKLENQPIFEAVDKYLKERLQSEKVVSENLPDSFYNRIRERPLLRHLWSSINTQALNSSEKAVRDRARGNIRYQVAFDTAEDKEVHRKSILSAIADRDFSIVNPFSDLLSEPELIEKAFFSDESRFTRFRSILLRELSNPSAEGREAEILKVLLPRMAELAEKDPSAKQSIDRYLESHRLLQGKMPAIVDGDVEAALHGYRPDLWRQQMRRIWETENRGDYKWDFSNPRHRMLLKEAFASLSDSVDSSEENAVWEEVKRRFPKELAFYEAKSDRGVSRAQFVASLPDSVLRARFERADRTDHRPRYFSTLATNKPEEFSKLILDFKPGTLPVPSDLEWLLNKGTQDAFLPHLKQGSISAQLALLKYLEQKHRQRSPLGNRPDDHWMEWEWWTQKIGEDAAWKARLRKALLSDAATGAHWNGYPWDDENHADVKIFIEFLQRKLDSNKVKSRQRIEEIYKAIIGSNPMWQNPQVKAVMSAEKTKKVSRPSEVPSPYDFGQQGLHEGNRSKAEAFFAQPLQGKWRVKEYGEWLKYGKENAVMHATSRLLELRDDDRVLDILQGLQEASVYDSTLKKLFDTLRADPKKHARFRSKLLDESRATGLLHSLKAYQWDLRYSGDRELLRELDRVFPVVDRKLEMLRDRVRTVYPAALNSHGEFERSAINGELENILDPTLRAQVEAANKAAEARKEVDGVMRWSASTDPLEFNRAFPNHPFVNLAELSIGYRDNFMSFGHGAANTVVGHFHKGQPLNSSEQAVFDFYLSRKDPLFITSLLSGEAHARRRAAETLLTLPDSELRPYLERLLAPPQRSSHDQIWRSVSEGLRKAQQDEPRLRTRVSGILQASSEVHWRVLDAFPWNLGSEVERGALIQRLRPFVKEGRSNPGHMELFAYSEDLSERLATQDPENFYRHVVPALDRLGGAYGRPPRMFSPNHQDDTLAEKGWTSLTDIQRDNYRRAMTRDWDWDSALVASRLVRTPEGRAIVLERIRHFRSEDNFPAVLHFLSLTDEGNGKTNPLLAELRQDTKLWPKLSERLLLPQPLGNHYMLSPEGDPISIYQWSFSDPHDVALLRQLDARIPVDSITRQQAAEAELRDRWLDGNGDIYESLFNRLGPSKSKAYRELVGFAERRSALDWQKILFALHDPVAYDRAFPNAKLPSPQFSWNRDKEMVLRGPSTDFFRKIVEAAALSESEARIRQRYFDEKNPDFFVWLLEHATTSEQAKAAIVTWNADEFFRLVDAVPKEKEAYYESTWHELLHANPPLRERLLAKTSDPRVDPRVWRIFGSNDSNAKEAFAKGPIADKHQAENDLATFRRRLRDERGIPFHGEFLLSSTAFGELTETDRREYHRLSRGWLAAGRFQVADKRPEQACIRAFQQLVDPKSWPPPIPPRLK